MHVFLYAHKYGFSVCLAFFDVFLPQGLKSPPPTTRLQRFFRLLGLIRQVRMRQFIASETSGCQLLLNARFSYYAGADRYSCRPRKKVITSGIGDALLRALSLSPVKQESATFPAAIATSDERSRPDRLR